MLAGESTAARVAMSLGIKPVEGLTHYMGAHGFGGFHHCIADVVYIIEECGVALP